MGKIITYDPNYRANLWPDAAAAVAQMKSPLKLVDILKVSDEELPLLTGTTDYETGTALLAEQGIRLVFVTLGPDGVFYRMGGQTGRVAGVPCTVGDTNLHRRGYQRRGRHLLRRGPLQTLQRGS